MKQIEIFYLNGCPYCRDAQRAVAELLAEEPAYKTLAIRWVEETEEKALADSRDYYWVPSLFFGMDKLYEAFPGEGYGDIKAQLKAAFDRVLAA